MKKLLMFFVLIGSLVNTSFGQTITLTSAASPVNGTICPGITSTYTISNYGSGCKPNWTPTNGTLISPNGTANASIIWDDTPGAKATLSVTFSGCTSSGDNSKSASWSRLILSVKDQAWDAYGTVVNVDFCTRQDVTLTMPRMYVQGTGGIAQPPLQEVQYSWTLPSGWATRGSLITDANFITIYPIKCSVPGQVQVNGSIKNRCGSAGLSAPAIINLNGITPSVTMAPQFGYSGVSTACNQTPVTFTAATNYPFSCLTSYTWTKPTGWSVVSQSGNTITLRPSGNASDAGIIYATANFSCGSTYSSGNYTIRYVDPAIVGITPLCSSSTYTISNTVGSSVIWSSSNTNIMTVTSNGVASAVGSVIGFVTLTATFLCPNSPPPVTKEIWVGQVSNSSGLVIGGPSTPSPNGVYTYQLSNGTNFMLPPSGQGTMTYSWRIPQGNGWGYYNEINNSPSIDIWVGSTAGSVEAYWWNGCPRVPKPGEPKLVRPGTGTYLYVTPTVNGGGGCCAAASVYPNPAGRMLHVQLAKVQEGMVQMFDSPIILTLYNAGQKVVYQTTTTDVQVSIPLDDIPTGDYFLTISSKGKVEQKRVYITK